MASPPAQSTERARLRRLIEDQVADLDITWAELAETSGLPYETIRRVRTGDRPITRDTRHALEGGLQWAHGSIRAILDGGDPTPARPPTLDQGPAVDTSIGRVEVRIARDPGAATEGLTGEQVDEIERRLAARMRTEAPLFVEMLAREMKAKGEET